MEMWETVEVWVSGFIELEAVGFPDCGISSSPALVGKRWEEENLDRNSLPSTFDVNNAMSFYQK